MAGLGRKTFSPGDVLTSSDVQNYLMDQSVMVFAGTAARASAIPSPSAGMVAYSTATSLQVYNGTAWVAATTGYGVASGTAAFSTAITVSGVNYTLLTFTADSNLVVSTAGLFDAMLIGGGGGGGNREAIDTVNSGGGGAGGVAVATVYLASGTYAVDVGAGGAAEFVGLSSTLGSTTPGSTVAPTAVGGGAGTGFNPNFLTKTNTGGSAGAARNDSGAQADQIPGQGNSSGAGQGSLGNGNGSGGGGGAGAAGSAGTSSVGGAGGAGIDVSTFIGGSSLFKAGGGGGSRVSGSGGAGGSSVGGAGASSVTGGGNAAANTGSGGGGGDSGGTGGSGIVYVRFKV